METISLKFRTKEQLLGFYGILSNKACFIDLKNYVFSAPLSDSEIGMAQRKFGGFVLQEEAIY